jgi:MFS family permease
MDIFYKDPYISLKQGSFRYFLLAKFFYTISFQVQSLVISWHVYKLTNDPLALGLIGFLEALPGIVVALFAGHFADNFVKKKIIVYSLVSIIICSLLLIYSALFEHNLKTNNAVLFFIYSAILLIGISRSFLAPAQFSILPLTLPNQVLYKNAATWNSIIWQSSQVLGPLLGAYLYIWKGILFSYFISILLILIAIMIFLNLELFQEEKFNLQNDSIISSMREGINFIKKHQEILGAMTLDLIAVLFGGTVALLPIFANKILNVGAQGLGYLKMAPAMGAIAMMALLTYFPVKRNAGKIMIFSVACYGICMILFALSKNLILSVFLLALSGSFDAVSVVIRQTMMQVKIPDNMKGRIAAINNVFVGSSNELGAFESGLAAKILGLIPSVIFGGSITVLVSVYAYFKFSKLRKVNF